MGPRSLMNDDETSSVIQALAHERRRQIISILGEEGPKGVTELKKRLGMSTGSLYHNLSFLSGIVERTPERKYRLTEKGEELYEMLRDGTLAPRVIERRGLRRLEPILFPTWIFSVMAGFEPYSFLANALIVATLMFTSYDSGLGVMFIVPVRAQSPLLAVTISAVSYSLLASLSTLVFGLRNLARQFLSPAVALLPQIIYQLVYIKFLGTSAPVMVTETLGLLLMGFSALLLGAGIRASSNARVSHSLLFAFVLLYLGSILTPLLSGILT